MASIYIAIELHAQTLDFASAQPCFDFDQVYSKTQTVEERIHQN